MADNGGQAESTVGIGPHPELIDVLRHAYLPCSNIDVCDGVCPEAKWRPAEGHIPRGFLGATGDLEEVELVMLCDQPGRPHKGEVYDADPKADPTELLLASVQYAHKCFSACEYQFHQNARWFMKKRYSKLSFDEQLRRVWVTQSRLCSIANGNERDPTCAKRYLASQIDLLPKAMVVAFGQKAQRRMRQLAKHHRTNVRWWCAPSLAPRNLRQARLDWEEVVAELKSAQS